MIRLFLLMKPYAFSPRIILSIQFGLMSFTVLSHFFSLLVSKQTMFGSGSLEQQALEQVLDRRCFYVIP